MANLQPVTEFSAERQLRLRRMGGETGVGATELLEAVRELRGEIVALREAQPETPDIPQDELPGFKESLAVRMEIAQMVRMIGRAKLEIASIKHPMAEDDRMLAAASELDAIVVATETSTEDILAASEQIEGLVRGIAALHPDDEEFLTLGDQIANEIIKIFEACNFQDITGQRINKVVKTIRFIEERVLAMINIWGAEAFAELPIQQATPKDEDDGLMNGPQLANQGITQDEINALFD